MFVRALRSLLLALLLCLTAALSASAEDFLLGIVHSNDSHGNILPFRGKPAPDAPSLDGWGGMARRRVAIQRARADLNYQWLTLDAGDVLQGTPLSNLLTGYLDLECMNQMGYEAMTLGNHEFDFGYELLRSRIADVNFPVLCANVVDKERGRPVGEPYVILQRGGYRIGVIGVTTETLLGETIPALASSVDVYPATPVCRELAGYLRSVGCDIVIALTHQGHARDLAMAAQVPDLDVIIGGHSHTFLDAPVQVPAANPAGYVLVAQSWEWGKVLGVKKLRFTRTAPDERLRLAEVLTADVPLSPDLPEDDGLRAFIADYNARFEAEMNRVVATAMHDFPVDTVRTEENALANMIGDALRGAAGADIALFNGGNFRAGLGAGPVSFGDLYRVLPYDNILIKLPVTGARLRELLQIGGSQYGDGGFPQVSGMRIRYLDGKLASCEIGGQPLDDGATYNLLVTDFVASGGDGYLLAGGERLSSDPYGPGYTGLEQRAAFALWASQQRELSCAADGRVVFDWSSGTPPLPQE